MRAQLKVESDFSKSHPLVIKTLAGDTFTLADWGTTRNLHTALCEMYPSQLGDGGRHSFELRAVSDNTVISPELGGRGRQRLISREVGCDELVLAFTAMKGVECTSYITEV
jgi:hypothetical protein